MRKFIFSPVVIMLVFLSCNKEVNQIDASPYPIQNRGYKMLLIGNSFFRPYAEKLDDLSHYRWI